MAFIFVAALYCKSTIFVAFEFPDFVSKCIFAVIDFHGLQSLCIYSDEYTCIKTFAANSFFL